MTPPLTGDTIKHLRHDLRTPINHILGYTEILLEDYEVTQATGSRWPYGKSTPAARSCWIGYRRRSASQHSCFTPRFAV
jgi:signal transduction histidine kinase